MYTFSLLSVIVPPRKSAKKMMAKGFFPDSEVVRGHDWLWGDQDGMDNMESINNYLELTKVL